MCGHIRKKQNGYFKKYVYSLRRGKDTHVGRHRYMWVALNCTELLLQRSVLLGSSLALADPGETIRTKPTERHLAVEITLGHITRRRLGGRIGQWVG